MSTNLDADLAWLLEEFNTNSLTVENDRCFGQDEHDQCAAERNRDFVIVAAVSARLAAETQRADGLASELQQVREHALTNPNMKMLHDNAKAYLEAVVALQKVRGGAPLSTSLAWLIEQGHLVPAQGSMT
jgi:hypothetical protein